VLKHGAAAAARQLPQCWACFQGLTGQSCLLLPLLLLMLLRRLVVVFAQ
jgi:hypothetical protein